MQIINYNTNMKFVKLNNFWWQYDENTPKNSATLFNIYGGKNSLNDITNCEIVEAKDFQNLNWKDTAVWDDKCKLGWLDRDGNFFGCSYEYHEMQAYLVHHSTPRQLEKLGWIHISTPSKYDSYIINAQYFGDYENGVMPTDAQLNYLMKRADVQINNVIFAIENGNKEKARIYEQEIQKQKKAITKDEDLSL